MTNIRLTALTLALVVLTGCNMSLPNLSMSGLSRTEPSDTAAKQLARTEEVLDVLDAQQKSVTAASTVPTLQGVGYAVVSVQPGRTVTQKRLLAIRAARLDAMRALTEQIHGLHVNSSTTVAEAVVQSDTLRATVTGVIRGARTVHIEPKTSDTYEVLLEIDRDMIDRMIKMARRWI